mmetsp:Transcript_80715/g.142963  ORF Transcript_80715/g.142963 Transcript_80715/m.142963 type:complete len:212 (+) Transcript_80715:332-967(+)
MLASSVWVCTTHSEAIVISCSLVIDQARLQREPPYQLLLQRAGRVAVSVSSLYSAGGKNQCLELEKRRAEKDVMCCWMDQKLLVDSLFESRLADQYLAKWPCAFPPILSQTSQTAPQGIAGRNRHKTSLLFSVSFVLLSDQRPAIAARAETLIGLQPLLLPLPAASSGAPSLASEVSYRRTVASGAHHCLGVHARSHASSSALLRSVPSRR